MTMRSNNAGGINTRWIIPLAAISIATARKIRSNAGARFTDIQSLMPGRSVSKKTRIIINPIDHQARRSEDDGSIVLLTAKAR